MGRRMAVQGHRPDLIVSSPANRALSTARNIALELGCDVSAIVTDENLYFSGRGGMWSVLEALDDRYLKVMLVGHNPAMTNLMNILANTSVINMPTCAIAVIGLDIASWSDLYLADGNLLGYDFPKGSGSFKVEL